jgi:NTE family protein
MADDSPVTSATSAITPVEFLPGEKPGTQLEAGVALCLSGGGYRAMLFHVGAIMRLNEMGLLEQMARVSSVSGGSIAAGVLALNWEKLDFRAGVAQALEAAFVHPIRALAGSTIDVVSVIGGVLTPGSAADKLANAYRDKLFGQATLQDIPDRPRFVFNATNVQSKALWRFSKPYMWDYRVGKVENPTTELAIAVAASSAFPPVLSPLELHLDPSSFVPGSGMDLQREPFTSEVVLTDGGVYDNLGLETAWKRYDTLWVSDGGGMYAAEADPKRDWLGHTHRVMQLMDNQVRSLRKRQLMGSYHDKIRKGAYWGIWSDINEYGLSDALPCSAVKTQAIAATATRLKALEAASQERIINWGYAVCDAAMRKFGGMAGATAPTKFPYKVGVG